MAKVGLRDTIADAAAALYALIFGPLALLGFLVWLLS